jgi:hypothetical protein
LPTAIIEGASWRDRKPIPNFGGDASIGGAGSSAPVQATLAGSADVMGGAALTVKIEAPELIKAFHDSQGAISLVGRLNSNGPGSTGRSSPDAQAPGGTGLTYPLRQPPGGLSSNEAGWGSGAEASSSRSPSLKAFIPRNKAEPPPKPPSQTRRY